MMEVKFAPGCFSGLGEKGAAIADWASSEEGKAAILDAITTGKTEIHVPGLGRMEFEEHRPAEKTDDQTDV